MNKIGIGFIAVALTASALAHAGNVDNQQLTISGSNVQGTLRAIRNSADTVQLLTCNTYAYDNGNEYGSCYARSAAGVFKQCFAKNAQQLNVMRAISAVGGWVSFTIAADNYYCSQVVVAGGSPQI